MVKGTSLNINYASSAAGSVRIELQDSAGQPLPGFSLTDCPELYGDSIEQTVSWAKGRDLTSLAGQPIRLRFELRDADLYSFRFGKPATD